ncbi:MULTISPECIES: hypothetical protein [unclassified Streptomyces]|uniref:hypothetical protein n=1 Tax=unclassified Streptomyces TaxID=2593676 RepID=UPI002E2B2921|nr:hypothetical protein [Streptomyces sp. NBC_00223]
MNRRGGTPHNESDSENEGGIETRTGTGTATDECAGRRETDRGRGAGREQRRGGAGPRGSRDKRRTGPPGRTRHRRALRREAPVVVAVLLDERDFTAMTGYPSFPFEDYGSYLHHLDGLLRSLDAQGTHLAVTLFDPDAYRAYCRSTRQPPDSPATRVRYVAEVTTTGPAVRYTRQPLTALRTELAREADRRATWERATDRLTAAGPCPDCGQDLATCAFDRASHTLLRLIEAVGPGHHHVVCSLPTDEEPPLLAAVRVDADPEGEVRFTEADALVLCTVMAASEATDRVGGLVVRTTDAAGAETVRGWELRAGEPYPLSEARVFDAYCTDPATGEPVPPEPGVTYRAGLPLPPTLPEEGPAM